MCGLKEETQSEIRKLNPVGLEAKMLMVQVIEDDQTVQLKRIHGASGNPNLSIKMPSSGPKGQEVKPGQRHRFGSRHQD